MGGPIVDVRNVNWLEKPIATGYLVRMVTVFRADGLRVVIFVDDHMPAHVHIFGDRQAKINLAGPDGRPELVWADGMARTEVRKAMRIAIDQQALQILGAG